MRKVATQKQFAFYRIGDQADINHPTLDDPSVPVLQALVVQEVPDFKRSPKYSGFRQTLFAHLPQLKSKLMSQRLRLHTTIT